MKNVWLKILILAVIVFSVGTLSAKSVVDVYMEGGFFMHLITGLLIIMLVMAIVKFWTLQIKEKIDAKGFYLKLKGYVKNGQIEEAVKISSQFKTTTIGFIFWSGLLGFKDAKASGKKGAEMQNATQNAFNEASLQAIPHLEAGLFWLDIVAQVATLLGLLGTIFGLIAAFEALANAPEADKSRLLTEGISQAMGTTAYGLVVAIPTMFIKGGLQARADKIVNEIDEYSVKIINQITYSIKD
jgi:biopolymer transport protein ExbB